MSKSLRLSEKWFRRGLWLVALVFASFLIGLGGTIVGDLPKVETPLRVDDFLDKPAADKLRAEAKAARQAEQDAQTALEQAQLQRSKVRSEVQAERDSFNNWLSTRSATQRADQDPEVLARTQALDVLKLAERKTQQAVEAQQQAALDARQTAAARQEQLNRIATAQVPHRGVAAHLGADDRAHHGRGQAPMEKAGWKVPDADGVVHGGRRRARARTRQ